MTWSPVCREVSPTGAEAHYSSCAAALHKCWLAEYHFRVCPRDPLFLLSLEGHSQTCPNLRPAHFKRETDLHLCEPTRSLRCCGPLSTSPDCSQHKAHSIAHRVTMLLFPKTTSGTWILTTQGCLGNTCSLNSSRHKGDRCLAHGHCFKEQKSRYPG